ncbi:hypothetical protein [Haloechinothrix salitolerans]|uniref:Uncharacterized protein n=1 Tax=Haloechinothrix salitolerans TaxID=926830 RepID=A0ABW2C1E2_9PSEU
MLSAAIATTTNYLDICDDWEPTLQMLELDGAARAAGVTAVIGMGASPGSSNLLALLAMNQCDTVDRVYTAWRAGALPSPPMARSRRPMRLSSTGCATALSRSRPGAADGSLTPGAIIARGMTCIPERSFGRPDEGRPAGRPDGEQRDWPPT